jgi:hypothetical protein
VLESGWEPNTPIGDTLLRRFVFALADAWTPAIAAVGARHIAHGLVVLALGATLPAARHGGCWSAMVRSRLAAAPDLPAAALFSDDSRPGAERVFGFLPISRFTLWMRSRPPH